MGAANRGIEWSLEGGLATVRLSREHGNAISDRLLNELMAAIRNAGADSSVKGVLLAARGRLFCPGLDLIEAVSHDRPAMAAFIGKFCACVLEMYEFSKPLVAALSGHALAGGCLLALPADWRVLKRGALVGLNEIHVGVPLPFGLALILRDTVHSNRLDEVALLGRNYADDEAVATGLVHEIHGEDGFEAHCLERLDEYVSREPRAFAATKRYLRSATVERIRAENRSLLEEFLDCWFSEGTRRRIEAIVGRLKQRDESSPSPPATA